MLRPTAAFRLNQQTKRVMATIIDVNKAHGYRRSMIEAQLAEAIQPRTIKPRLPLSNAKDAT